MTITRRSFRTAMAGLLLGASTLAAGGAIAQTAFTTLDKTSTAEVDFSSGERGKPILAGSEASVEGENFRPGQKVTLLYGTTPLGTALTADAEGKISGKVAVPANAVPGIHPVLFVAESPYHAAVAELKVSPTVPLSGQANYNVTQAQVTKGLYQSALSSKNNALFVTSAVGRPPVSQSELVKLDSNSLKVLARVTPAEAPASPGRPRPAGAAADAAPPKPGVFAVYGVGVDDAKDMVWVTNTRQNTVAVYRQSDLGLVKQFAPGTVPHARDVIVDQSLGKAYASATGTPDVVVIDTGTLEVAKKISVRSKKRGEEFSAASLSFDAAAHRLYVAGFSTSEVAVINTQTDEVENVFAVPGGRSTIGISHDPQTGRIFVAAQGSDNLIVLDGKDGKVIADTPIGAGALNVVFDPVKRLAYVANRGAGTVAVTDVDGKIVANLGAYPLANHVALGKAGTIYVVDKSAGVAGTESDTILRIAPKR